MPTYQYQCTACGHHLEEFQSITEAPLVRCPACETDNLVRTIGAGAGLIFKGTGFYLTDYKKEAPKQTATGTEKKEKAAPAPPAPGSDQKSTPPKTA